MNLGSALRYDLQISFKHLNHEAQSVSHVSFLITVALWLSHHDRSIMTVIIILWPLNYIRLIICVAGIRFGKSSHVTPRALKALKSSIRKQHRWASDSWTSLASVSEILTNEEAAKFQYRIILCGPGTPCPCTCHACALFPDTSRVSETLRPPTRRIWRSSNAGGELKAGAYWSRRKLMDQCCPRANHISQTIGVRDQASALNILARSVLHFLRIEDIVENPDKNNRKKFIVMRRVASRNILIKRSIDGLSSLMYIQKELRLRTSHYLPRRPVALRPLISIGRKRNTANTYLPIGIIAGVPTAQLDSVTKTSISAPHDW